MHYLVLRPKDYNVVGIKWIFKNKPNENGAIVWHKARLATQRYAQVRNWLGWDFAPVVSL